MQHSYLAGLRERTQDEALKRCIAFGLVLGWGGLILGGLKAFFTPAPVVAAWQAVMGCGLVLLSAAVIAPMLLSPLERTFFRLAGALGKTLFAVVLTVVYLLLLWPMGLWTKGRKREQGFCEWDDHAPDLKSAWCAYEGGEEPERDWSVPKAAGLPFVIQPLLVLLFFIRRGRTLYVPVLLLLLVLGLVMFFAQTSSLAPFLYTLF